MRNLLTPFSTLLLIGALFFGSAWPSPSSARVMPVGESPATPVQVKLSPGRVSQATGMTWVPGSMQMDADTENAARAVLAAYQDQLPQVATFAVTDTRTLGNFSLVSVAGLSSVGAGQAWHLEDGMWFGLLLLENQGDGRWQGALAGTAAFDALLDGTPGGDSLEGLDPLAPAASASGFIFPWRPGTAMEYVSGVHQNGFPTVVHGWLAVDFISDGKTSAGRAPNELVASAAGTISFKCSPGAGEKTAAIIVDGLMYTHLVNSADLYPGRVLKQGEVIGQLQAGSFDENCGIAKQGVGQFHVHLGFASDNPPTIEGWKLNLRDHRWYRGDEVRNVHDMFVAGADKTAPVMSAQVAGVAGGGKEEAAMWSLLPLLGPRADGVWIAGTVVRMRGEDG